ncbi:hypothetical protein A2U01_0084906, partial [Trifolium medium]|nr:hypothetical protein [Trifolium medium]
MRRFGATHNSHQNRLGTKLFNCGKTGLMHSRSVADKPNRRAQCSIA